MGNDYSALFEDEEELRFGCVLFELKEGQDGSSSATPEKGWASVAGESPRMVYSPDDLDRDTVWLTNLSKEALWKTSAANKKRLKDSAYLRTDLSQIMKETGLSPSRITTANSAQAIGEIFARIMGLAREHYGIAEFGAASLSDEIRGRILGEDDDVGEPFDQALMRGYCDFVSCSNMRESHEMLVTLRRPRIAHAKHVLATILPQGPWEVVMPDQFPEGQERLEWLLGQDRPGVVRVSVKRFRQGVQGWNVPLLNMGEALIENGKKKERDWLTLQEAHYLSKYMVLDAKGAILAKDWKDFEPLRPLHAPGPLAHMSYSAGILAECHWIAASGRHRDGLSKQKIKVSPRSCFQRAADRFYCFNSAGILASAGFKVLSYGLGAVSVATEKSRLGELAKACLAANLTMPAALLRGEN